MMLRKRVWTPSASLRVAWDTLLCVVSASCWECRMMSRESMKVYCLSRARGDSQSVCEEDRQYALSTTSTSHVKRTW